MKSTHRGVSSLILILSQFQPRAIPKPHYVYKICLSSLVNFLNYGY